LVNSLHIGEKMTNVTFAPDNQTFVTSNQTTFHKADQAVTKAYIWKKVPIDNVNHWQLNLTCRTVTKKGNATTDAYHFFSTFIYQESANDYTDNVFALQGRNNQQKAMLAQRVANLSALIEQYEKAMAARKQIEEQRLAQEADLLRSYGVNNFGIYNWDKPVERNAAVEIEASFALADKLKSIEKQLRGHTKLFLVTGNSSTVVQRVPFSGVNHLIFLPQNARLVIVLPNNQVSIYSAKEFRLLVFGGNKKPKAHVFEFDFSHAVPFGSIDELQNLLEKAKTS
jgi:hypothetical protein